MYWVEYLKVGGHVTSQQILLTTNTLSDVKGRIIML
jgi:hypothetical protein